AIAACRINSASGVGPLPPPESTSSGAAPRSKTRRPISSRRRSAAGPRQPRTTIASASQHLTAIDGNILAGDPAGERRRKEQRNLRDFLWVAEPAERDASEDAAVQVRIVGLDPGPGAAGEFDRAGGDAVDPDPLLRKRRRLGQGVFQDCGLDGSVRRRADRSSEARDRG